MSKQPIKSHLRKFTYAQIDKKVNERKDVPQYYQLLMDSAVTKDEGGVVFDTTHPSWKLLVKIVKRVTAKLKSSGGAGSGSSSSGNNGSGTGTGSSNSGSAKTASAGAGSNRVDSSSSYTSSATAAAGGLTAGPATITPTASAINPGDQHLLGQIEHELEGETPDKHLIRHSCKICGIPKHLRGQIWRVLLGATSEPDDQEPSTVAFDMHNQRVVKADIDRTLSHMEVFRTSKVRADMELLLTRYCKAHTVSYKQGMNYILAPFFLIDLDNRDDMFHCYEAFIGSFLSNTFTDDDFGGLQCLFALFRLLLLYHDPELSNYLDQYDMGPELYASSWFITLFSNRLDIDVLLHLWDSLILEREEDSLLHVFVSLSLLISHREEIMNENVVALPQFLSGIKINSTQEVDGLVSKAKLLYRSQTPQSVRHRMHSITTMKINVDSWEMRQMQALPCVSVSADEIVRHCYEAQGKTNPIKFYVVDCRPRRLFEAGHLPCAHHLDPDLLAKPQKLNAEVEKLQSMKGVHFCFVSQGGEGQAKARASGAIMNQHFLQMGFKYVSVVEGGYHECHKIINVPNSAFELVDHNPKVCAECNPRSKGSKGIFSAFKRRVKGLMSDKGSSAASDGVSGTPNKDKRMAKLAEDLKSLNIPDTTLELSHTNEVALLHTMLRDRKTTGSRLFKCVDRLAALVMGEAFDGLELREKEVTTSSGGLYTGVESLVSVCGIALTEVDEIVLKRALEPFSYISHVELGQIRFLHSPFRSDTPRSVGSPRSPSPRTPTPRSQLSKNGVSISVYLPDDVASRSVYVYTSVLGPENEEEVFESINELSRHGVVRITIVCIIAARPVVWRIAEKYENVLVATGSVDEVQGSTLVPGAGNLEERMEGYIRSMTRLEKRAEVRHSVDKTEGSKSRRKFQTLG